MKLPTLLSNSVSYLFCALLVVTSAGCGGTEKKVVPAPKKLSIRIDYTGHELTAALGATVSSYTVLPDGTHADAMSVLLPASARGSYQVAVDPTRDLVVTVAFRNYHQGDPISLDSSLLAYIFVDGVYRTGKSLMVEGPVLGPDGYPSVTSTIHASEW